MTDANGGGDGQDPLGNFPYAFPASAQRSSDRLTAAERASIESYAYNGYERVNQALRGQRTMTPDIQVEVDRIRAGLRKYPLESDVRVTREVSGAVFDIGDEARAQAAAIESLIDEVFEEDGFMSTSMGPLPAHSTARRDPITLDLLVPAGTPAFAVGELSGAPLEHEMLIIDARRFQIIAARYDELQNRWRLYGVVDSEA